MNLKTIWQKIELALDDESFKVCEIHREVNRDVLGAAAGCGVTLRIVEHGSRYCDYCAEEKSTKTNSLQDGRSRVRGMKPRWKMAAIISGASIAVTAGIGCIGGCTESSVTAGLQVAVVVSGIAFCIAGLADETEMRKEGRGRKEEQS